MRLTNIIDQLKDEVNNFPTEWSNTKRLKALIKELEEYQALNIAKLRDIENLTTKLRILS